MRGRAANKSYDTLGPRFDVAFCAVVETREGGGSASVVGPLLTCRKYRMDWIGEGGAGPFFADGGARAQNCAANYPVVVLRKSSILS